MLTLDLNKDQLQRLAILIESGHWLINSYRDEPLEEYESIVQLVRKQLKEAGLEEEIKHEEKMDFYFPTEELEEKFLDLSDQYNEDNFQESFAYKMADRDFYRKYRKEQLEAMEEMEIFDIRGKMADKYKIEIAEHGLDRFTVNPRLGRKRR